MTKPPRPVPPVAPSIPHRTEQLGRVRVDDYAWMKDDNWQAVMRDPQLLRADIRTHLEAENVYTDALLAPTKALQETLFHEMRGRIKEDDASVPDPDGAFEYYARYVTGGQHPVYARRPRAGGEEEVLLDVDALAKGHAFFQVSEAEHSPDHALFAYAADDQGSEYYRIHIKELATGELLAGPVESATGSFAFSPDSQWLFWVWRDENGRSAKVFRRPSRGGAGSDVLVYEEPDEGMFLSVGLTASRGFIVIGLGDHETSESRIIPAADPTAEPQVVEPRQVGLRYSIEHWDGRFVVLTNADDAVDYKLMWADVDAPGRGSWRDFVPHQPGRFITGLVATENHLARLERVDALNRIVVTERRSLAEHEVAFDEEAYGLSLGGGHEFATTVMRFVYQSPTTPKQWLDYDMATRERTLRKTQTIPSGHDPSAYVARRLYAAAPDGAQVPITVLMRKDTPLDGSAPLLLYGYGAYGMPMEPHFSIRTLGLVDRGWIHAVAHIRGGTEKGWGWFLDGRKDKKPNSFIDFIACAETLIAAGYGAAGRIVAEGRSAGGMLMGAVTNMRPDLWAGVIGGVPFVDVLNTMSDATLPLTPPEWPEWGDPLTDPAAYDLIAGYSPYENVTAQAYPAVLATGGLSDARVTYWEPSKWVAALRAHTTGTAPILLKMNMEAGHGGAAGRFDFLKEIALDYAFAIWAIERGWEKGEDQA
ncbi:MAG: S9 family peptidase [Caulobacterales bacterium 32-69-10]|nr:MAG: S9 family peptidase [Caulobacterales bacterium 32-69-10]